MQRHIAQLCCGSSYLHSVLKRKMTRMLLFCVLLISDMNQVPGTPVAGQLDLEAVSRLSNAINNSIQALSEGALSDDVIQAFTGVREQAKQILLAAGVDTTQDSTGESQFPGDDLRVVLMVLDKKFAQLQSLGGKLFQLKDQGADDQAIVEVVIGVEIIANSIIADVKSLGVETISYQPEQGSYATDISGGAGPKKPISLVMTKSSI